MHVDWTISFGTVWAAASIIVSIWWASVSVQQGMDKRLAVFESVLRDHALTLVGHAEKMGQQDVLLLKLVGDVQRLIGRLEERAREHGAGSAWLP